MSIWLYFKLIGPLEYENLIPSINSNLVVGRLTVFTNLFTIHMSKKFKVGKVIPSLIFNEI